MKASDLVKIINDMIKNEGDREIMVSYDRGFGLASIKNVSIEGEYDGDMFISINTDQ